MADDSGNQGTGGESGTPEGGQPQGQQGADGQVTLSAEQQQYVDGIIARRLRESQQRLDGEVERRVQEQIEREKMDAAQRATAERDEARQQAEKVTGESKRTVAEARVEVALLAAGIKPDRIDKVARLVNVDDVAGADDPKAAASDAVRAVLADFPEFRPTPGASGGELGGGGQQQTVTLEQFKGMDYDQRVALYRKDKGLYQQLTDAEQQQVA